MKNEKLFEEDVSFDHIGAGGIEGDQSLKDLVNHAMQHLACMVKDPERDPKGSINIKITVEAEESSYNVIFSGTLSIKEPKHRPRELIAKAYDDGQVVTSQHKQLPLLPTGAVFTVNQSNASEKGNE